MSRARGWCFTLNNYACADESSIQGWDAEYVVYGREVAPTTTTKHLQGYVYFGKNKKSLKQVKKLLSTAHWEPAKGSPQQNRDYCTKDGDYFEKGQVPRPGGRKIAERSERNALLMNAPLGELVETGQLALSQVPLVKKARVVLAAELPATARTTTCGIWIHGPPGTGKTMSVHVNYESIYIKMGQNKWFDNYAGEKVILMDDFDLGGRHLGHHLKLWADKWPCYGEIKGGRVALRHDHFIVTSNYLPEDIWPDDATLVAAIRRRFAFKEFLVKYTS